MLEYIVKSFLIEIHLKFFTIEISLQIICYRNALENHLI